MKQFICLSVFTMCTGAFASVAAAGPSSGGGGYVVSCAQTPLEPAKVELLDLYEGENTLRFTMAVPTGSLLEDYFAGVKRTYTFQGYPQMADQLREDIVRNLRNTLRTIHFVAHAAEMPNAYDLGDLPWIPSACALEQIAFFDDAMQRIYVRKDLWEKLDSMNQAALLFHELWYRELRLLKDTTSIYARRTVAHIFAVRGPISLKDGLTDQSRQMSIGNYTESSTEISTFHLTANSLPYGGYRAQFSHLQGRPQLAKTWVDLPSFPGRMKFAIRNDLKGGCVVDSDETPVDIVLPMQGTLVPGLSIRYSYRKGEPVSFALMKNGTVLSTGDVQSCLYH